MNNSTTQSRESGAVLGFVLVLLLLAGLLAGGLWFIKYRADLAGKVDTVSKEVKEGASDAKKEVDDKAAEVKKDDAQGQATQPSGQNQSATGGSTSTQAAPSASTPNTQQAGPSNVASTGPSSIASTGPVDVFMNAYLLGSLVLVGYMYRQSRSASR